MIVEKSCIFCDIVNKKINANVVFENDQVLAFHDINKVSDVHLLIIPKIHIESIKHVERDHKDILAELMFSAQKLAEQFNVDGFRLVMNNGASAGQSVFHLHMHLLSGRKFSWPPG